MKKLFSRPTILILLGAMTAGFLLIFLVQFNTPIATNAPADEILLRAQSNRMILFIGIGLVAAAIILTVFVVYRSRLRPRVRHSEATTDGVATVPYIPSGTAPSNPLAVKDTQSSPSRPDSVYVQRPMAYLIGPGGQPIVIRSSDFSIGRQRDNHLVVNEPHVSRRHARIVMQHGHFMLCNLSQIGTVVNNTAVHQATILQGGEQIRIGTVDFRFTLATSPLKPPPTRQPS